MGDWDGAGRPSKTVLNQTIFVLRLVPRFSTIIESIKL